MENKCVLDETKLCTDCGECDKCDLNPEKVCDNCGKCIGLDSDSRAIEIEDVILLSKAISWFLTALTVEVFVAKFIVPETSP